MTATLRADDRVLLLAIPSPDEMAAMARLLIRGVLVAIGNSSEVDEARAAMSEFDNVMFIDALPGQIPWRDAYFTKILVPPHLERLLRQDSGELHRVLASGGEIVGQRVDC